MANSFESSIKDASNEQPIKDAQRIFGKIIQKDHYVGDLYSINYEEGKVLVHDFHRQRSGGIPSLCFLIATRVNPEENLDYKDEDCSVILLRVMDAAQIPQDREAEKVRVETAQRVSGETDRHWDGEGTMDLKTRQVFGFAGISCRIIGTFFLEEENDKVYTGLRLKFGSDISNYYPNRGLKVYKPSGEALEQIVNYIDPKNLQDHKTEFGNAETVKLGKVRYASTNRSYQEVNNVPIFMCPADLLSQKTALFGMTRTGKSNTTKIIAKSIYELRHPHNPYTEKNPNGDKPLRVGQIIFDPNGEYANENLQDASEKSNPVALKNVWQLHFKGTTSTSIEAQREKEIATYGILPHGSDPHRKFMLINFYLEDNLPIGKEIIDNSFRKGDSKFIENFQQVQFIKPEPTDSSATTRYNRRVLAYRALLAKAGFAQPSNFTVTTSRLFGDELLNGRPNAREVDKRFNGMLNVVSDPDNALKYKQAAEVFATPNPTLTSLANAFIVLFDYFKTSEYKAFENWYVNERSGRSGDYWADEDFKKILEMIWRGNGPKQIASVIDNHSPSTSSDYAEDIYNDLQNGKLVIIDQSSGDPALNKATAKRIMWKIFKGNQKLFREAKAPPQILIYIEEAHNLLPSGTDMDLEDVWVRTAKEGSKYKLGLVYATQEVSSIQRNILKNTSNWFISHLNNSDETKELCKYYDFIDFEPSIRRAQDKGFLRIKTLSNPFVIPVQADKFELDLKK
jgi:hypothetical protein